MKNSNITISYQQLSFQELSLSDKKTLDHAKQMAEKAYAPYSNFHVGASAQLENGMQIGGNNQENAAYPSGLCAERVALFTANSQYPDQAVECLGIYLPAVFNPTIPSPCGACRQVICEIRIAQDKPIRLLLMNGDNTVWLFNDANDLLPFSFTSDHLK